ncbi:MAG: heavy-metal-associated domain-containing protein [Candidatus Competibacteraceae bacterium]|nr:heavy-metal-associated domain-containing protein [Candidatus Competibacteraceae bacterium]
MKKYIFETNIMCVACVNNVSSVLNSFEGIHHWHVDLQSETRLLHIEASTLDVVKLKNEMESLGYNLKECQI